MIIDFHTHVFPDKIAQRALDKLAGVIHLTPSINGCASDLLSSMEKAEIDISVILPVVTNIGQFDSILRFADYLNTTYADRYSGRLISFAGIHPGDPNCLEQLKTIQSAGFKGIKLHPNYQGIDLSDIQTKRLIYTATELDLTILTHAGFDPYTPEHEFCTPDMVLDVLHDVEPEKLVLAHMGSNENYDEAEEKLCGQNVYLDTSYSIINMPEEQFLRMVKKHGASKILFATDCPWTEQKKCVDFLRNCALTPYEKQQIFYENAAGLLGIS